MHKKEGKSSKSIGGGITSQSYIQTQDFADTSIIAC